ncbi:MAG: hypothetical protein LT067_05500 [Sulfurovum sp.]|jgi:hypothetical protein|nr:hypothetical protein [Sulfurovum sp.]
MLTLKGQLLNIFTNNDFTKEDGTVIEGKTKLQLLVKMPMKNGQSKNELYDLSIPKEKIELYRQKIGKEVEVEVALIGKVTFYGI